MNADESGEIWWLFEQDGLRSLDEAEQHLMALETEPSSTEDLNGLYRALHSLKGNARVMGLINLEGLTHKTEDLVGLCREGIATFQGDAFEMVLEAADVLRLVVPEAVSARCDVSPDRVEDITERLGELLATLDLEGTRSSSPSEDGAVFEGACAVDFDFDFDGPDDAETDGPPADDAESLFVSSEDEATPDEAEMERVLAWVQHPPEKDAHRGEDEDESFLSASDEPEDEAEMERVLAWIQSSPEGTVPSAPSTAPAAKPKARKAPKGSQTRRDTMIQVRSSKIQELLAIASDLGLSTDSLLAHPGVLSLSEASEDVTEQAHRLRRLMRDLRFSAAGLALVPISELFAKVKRIARDLARHTGKDFEVMFDGEDTEIDKSLVDALSDPVLHIVRNAIDHGVESSADRSAAGKRPKGRIEVSAAYAGNEVLVTFSDDGKGIDPKLVERKALDRGLITEEHGLDEKAIQRLIFHPGFSTKDQVSELSGRGVGMDVVNESIKKLRGRVELNSTKGRGTSLSVYLPLTLAFADALVVEIGRFLYAVPLENVGRIFLPCAGDWSTNSADGIEYVQVKSTTVPVLWLDGAARRTEDGRQPIVTVRSSNGEMALPVDVLRGTEQITMRPLDRFSATHPAASSCGILSNGDVALTLDCERLVSMQAHTKNGPRKLAQDRLAVP